METQRADHQMSFYAATKKSNEAMAHSYVHLFNLPITMFRFFTVYGPWGRPDMALFKFTDAILNDRPIDVYNHDKMKRDFTYVDDIVSGIKKIIFKNVKYKYQIFNIGNGKAVSLMNYLREIEKNLNLKAKIDKAPLQAGDIIKTHSSVKKIHKIYGYKALTSYRKGIKNFIDWFKDYNNINEKKKRR